MNVPLSEQSTLFLLIILAIVFFVFLLPVIVSFKLNKNMLLQNCDLKPYRWGYFWALQYGIIFPIASLTLSIYSIFFYDPEISNRIPLPDKFSAFELLFPNFIIVSILLSVGWGFYNRKRWPWYFTAFFLGNFLLASVITFSWKFAFTMSVIILLNFLYIRPRWQELT